MKPKFILRLDPNGFPYLIGDPLEFGRVREEMQASDPKYAQMSFEEIYWHELQAIGKSIGVDFWKLQKSAEDRKAQG